MRRWCFGCILALLVVGSLVLGGALFALRSPVRERGGGTAVLPPARLPNQVQQLQSAIAQGRHGEPYTLALSDAELTTLVGSFVANNPNVPFGDVRVAVTGQKVVVEATTKGLAVNVPVRVAGTIVARDGVPSARVEDVSLGNAPLPGFVRDQVVQQINASLDFSRYAMPVTVETIDLRPGGTTIRGTVK